MITTVRSAFYVKFHLLYNVVSESNFNIGSFMSTHVIKVFKRVEDETSRKLLRTKVTPDFHLTYSKNGGNLVSESKWFKMENFNISP